MSDLREAAAEFQFRYGKNLSSQEQDERGLCVRTFNKLTQNCSDISEIINSISTDINVLEILDGMIHREYCFALAVYSKFGDKSHEEYAYVDVLYSRALAAFKQTDDMLHNILKPMCNFESKKVNSEIRNRKSMDNVNSDVQKTTSPMNHELKLSVCSRATTLVSSAVDEPGRTSTRSVSPCSVEPQGIEIPSDSEMPLKMSEQSSRDVASNLEEQCARCPKQSLTAKRPGYHRHELPCVLCPRTHRLWHCPVFRTMSPIERLAVVDHHMMCHNCFLSTHATKDCGKKTSCYVSGCTERHSMYIHIDCVSGKALSSGRHRKPGQSNGVGQSRRETFSGFDKNIGLNENVREFFDKVGSSEIVGKFLDLFQQLEMFLSVGPSLQNGIT